MSDHAIRRIVIVGGGTAGWMAAAAFTSLLDRRDHDIVLVESDEIGTVGVGEATIPPLQAFNHMVGIDEDQFLAASQGTFKLGIEFVGWGAEGERYFHPFGPHGQDYRGVHFHQLYLRESRLRELPDIRQWSMSGVAAELGRFVRPAPDAPMPLPQLGYAFHFDAGLYAKFLRAHSERGGVRRIEGKIVDVRTGGESGHVEAVQLASGEMIEGELFIDCSGFRGLLIEEKLGTGYEDWGHWLPCDRAAAVPTRLSGPPDPFTRSTARSAGWQWRIPLQHRMGNGLVYSSAHLERDEAARLLLANLEGEPLAEPRHLSFTAGRRRLAWNANVVSLGLSSGFIEPLESTSIHLIQSGIAKLLSLFPSRGCDPLVAEQYNRVYRADVESVRDFLILHYHRTQGRDEPLWRHCQAMSLPDSLVYKEEQFVRTGRIVLDTDELFREASWFAVMMGQGLDPADYNPLAETFSPEANAAYLLRLRTEIAAAARAAPTHEAFIEQRLAGGR